MLRTLDPQTLVTKWSELNRYADAAYAVRAEPYVGPPGLEFELGMVPELVRWRGELVEANTVGKPHPCGAEYILCLGMIYVVLRPVTRSLRRADASMFEMVANVLQLDLKALSSMVLVDLARHCGHEASDLMPTLWEWCQDKSYSAICRTRNMLCLMICEGVFPCSLLSKSGLELSQLLQSKLYTEILSRLDGEDPVFG